MHLWRKPSHSIVVLNSFGRGRNSELRDIYIFGRGRNSELRDIYIFGRGRNSLFSVFSFFGRGRNSLSCTFHLFGHGRNFLFSLFPSSATAENDFLTKCEHPSKHIIVKKNLRLNHHWKRKGEPSPSLLSAILSTCVFFL